MTSRFHDDEITFSGRYGPEVFESLRWAFREYRGRLLLIALAGLIGRSCLLANSIVVSRWADALCAGHTACRPLPGIFAGFTSRDFIFTLAGLTALGFVFSAMFNAGLAATGTRVAQRFHDETVARVARAPLGFFDRNPVGRIFTRFSSDYQHMIMAVGPHLGQVTAILFDITLMVVVIGFANIYFLPLILVTIAVNVLVYRLHKPLVRTERRAAAAERGPSLAHFSATVQGFLAIRVFRRERRFVEFFDATLGRYLKQRNRAELAFQAFTLQVSLITATLVLACGLIGIWLIATGGATVGEVGVVLTFVTLSSGLIQRLFTLVTSMEQGLSGIERLNHYLRMPLEPHATLPEAARYPTAHPRLISGAQSLVPSETARGAQLVVEDLRLAYGPGLAPVLDGITFTAEPGESIGIIGRTGSGKSTLFQALLYLYPKTAGALRVDGWSVDGALGARGQVDLTTWRAFFAYVAQDPVIFRGTVRSNLVRDEAAHADGELESVLRQVGLGAWLDARPGRLDARLAEAGSDLSQGQRQLLATARCLLSRAPIVLMDEATSAIDPATEAAFSRRSAELLQGRTRLVIAHRLSTVLDMDRLLWIDRGRVRMLGEPGEVLERFRKTRIERGSERLKSEPSHAPLCHQ